MAKAPEHVDNWTGDADLLYPSKYLRHADLQGKDATLTIERVEKGHELVMAGGVKDKKPVLHFSETPKMLVLAKTNKGRIADLYGAKCAAWIGERITLYPANGPSKEDVLKPDQRGIRVRAKKPLASTTAAAGRKAPPPEPPPEREPGQDDDQEPLPM